MKSLFRGLMVGALGCAWCSALAWNDTGHMVIAAIAQSNLSPKARAEASRLLSSTGTGSMTDFIKTSSWADETRTRENGPWHYEDHHFRLDGKPVTNKAEPENAVWAINKFSKVLADKKRPDAERAEALRYLIHFVGDIHQPLHATALDTDDLPKGDRGGNEYFIDTPRAFAHLYRAPRNLHSLWDMGCGAFMPDPNVKSPEGQAHIQDLATFLTKKFPRKSMKGVKDRNPEHWALGSFAICKAFVYSTPAHAAPSSEYLEKGRNTSNMQATLAGYRLADLLNRSLK